MTSEQFANERGLYTTDFNDTSLWLKTIIEGQSFLCGGDSAQTGARMIMKTFDKAYCTVDFFSVLHHAGNVYDYFTEFVTAHTAIYTTWRFASNGYGNPNESPDLFFRNQRLQKSVKEMYHYGDGTVVFTFPYQPNSAETLPKNEWIYGYTKTHPMRDYNK
jgi:beta-lactamase superfamily II metal-dependent hydrolase